MTLQELQTADAADVFLNTDDLAEAVLHRPLNVAADDETVDVIFHENDPQATSTRGIGVRRTAKLICSSSVSVSVKDRWQRNSEWWAATAVRGAESGMIEVSLVLIEDELRSGMRVASIV